MKKHFCYFFICLVSILPCFSQTKPKNKTKANTVTTSIPTNIINTFSFRNRYYFYKLEADEKEKGKWLMYIGTVTDEHSATLAASVKIFSTDVYTISGNDKLANVRIQAAKPFDYSWAVSRTNFLETSFYWTDGSVKYTLFGTQMQNEYASPVDEKSVVYKFTPSKLTFADGVKIAVNHFIMRFDKLFQYPENEDKKVKLETFEGDIVFRNEKYNYELRRGFFNVGDDNLAIRKGESGLIYNTLVRIKDEKNDKGKITIDIHHVLQNGLAWSVYASDYLRAIFDYNTGTVSYQQIGSALPYPDENEEIIKEFDPKSLSLEKAFEMAMQNLVRRYNEALPR
jgi:hypothetical protein